MSEIKLTNIPSLAVDTVIKDLSKMYIKVINNNLSLEVLPSVMLWGPMGVGKSQSIKELAKEIMENTNKKVKITDVRLLLFNPIDLRGIPTANQDKTLAIWLKPQIFEMDESNQVINILFLDEISAAPPSVQAAAYQITLDKKVGEHNLPKNCIVIAAGNRITDKSVCYNMPKALANRLLHFDVKANFDSWNRWAVSQGINDKVLGFLKFRPDYLMKFEPNSSDLAFATPRSWELVSNVLNYVSDDIIEVYDLVAGLVGTGIAIEFKTWSKIYKNLPNIEDIFKGIVQTVPKETDILYALVSSMVKYAKDHKDNLDLIENSINYALNLPPDYSIILIKDYLYIERDYRAKLLRIPAFVRFMQTRGKIVDAIK